MIQEDSLKQPSKSPSRSSLRSEGWARQPRVVQVNRDAATMVESEASAGQACANHADWECMASQQPHFRSRTFSDDFISNTSLELLLGVECEFCVALAAQTHCLKKHLSELEFGLVCNCNMQYNNYLKCQRGIDDHRGHSLNIYDLGRIKRYAGRSHLAIGSHSSLDRKTYKSKTICTSNYISKQLISNEQTNTLMQKIKIKLSNLKKIRGEAMTKRQQNMAQLAEITSDSSSSLKKLSMLSLVDKSQRKANSQTCIFTFSGYPKDEPKSAATYANFSDNVDQSFDRLREFNVSSGMSSISPHKIIKIRSFDNNDDLVSRNSMDETKFSALDNRSQCKSLRRQISYNDFPSKQFRDNKISESWVRYDTYESQNTHTDLVDEDAQAIADANVMVMSAPCASRAHCTCDSTRTARTPSIFCDTQGKKRSSPAPDVTERAYNTHVALGACKLSGAPQWLPTGTISTTSHSSTTTGNSSRFSIWHRRWCLVAILVLVAGTACVAGPLALRAPIGAPLHERLRLADRLLHDTPLVDGHNDLPWNIRKFLHNRINDFRFDEDLRTVSPWATSSWSHTDLPRLKQGRVAAQFWAAYVPCDAQHRDAVQLTFEQIDLIQRLTNKYQPQLTLCTSSDDIIAAHMNHRVCSLVGVEGGHAIGSSLGVLRTLFQVGVRYLTLTSTCDTPWAECASAERTEQATPPLRGLTPFGKRI